MLELDGYGVARKVGAHRSREQTDLIALAGFGQTKDKQKSEEPGFDRHLKKPIAPIELTQFLRA